MDKKGVSLSFETIVVLIIILVALALIIFFVFRNYTDIFNSFRQQANATTSLARGVSIPKP